ncbi:hypothetical protein AURDEDRAFT_160066 [Auricularia subglabra TFB-10046 SS5]|nr:hypothetical protein AURDEDRAFT_160066 [Auricularia subglabra TFB-10046 SS5]
MCSKPGDATRQPPQDGFPLPSEPLHICGRYNPFAALSDEQVKALKVAVKMIDDSCQVDVVDGIPQVRPRPLTDEEQSHIDATVADVRRTQGARKAAEKKARAATKSAREGSNTISLAAGSKSRA